MCCRSLCFSFVTLFTLVTWKIVSRPVFIHSPQTQNLQCSRYIAGIDLKAYNKSRVVCKDPEKWEELRVDCASIFGRTYFQREELYPEERDFPIAYVRVLYVDYMLIEKELGATYAPQNFYCFALDAKSPIVFRQRVHALASCFPNVIVTQKEFPMNSAGKNMGYSHHECLRLLTKPEIKWEYVILLQNHELMTKTNQELIQIFKWFNGTNEVEASEVSPSAVKMAKTEDWSFEALQVFRNKTRNTMSNNGYEPVIRLTKSTTHVSLSRRMVDFLFEELDISLLMRRFELDDKLIETFNGGRDELLWGTLNTNDAIAVPGGFTHHCVDEGIEYKPLTMQAFWGRGDSCRLGISRHGLCMVGMVDLNEISTDAHLSINKILPGLDYGAIECWHELMHNRTHLDRGIHRLNSTFYLNLLPVRFNRERHEQGGRFNPSNFKCKT